MTEIGNYLIGKTIGQGTFSKVCQAIHQVQGHEAAVKVLEKTSIIQEGDVERVKREISILKQLNHPQIVKLYEIIETETHIYLFMEYAGGGELFDYIDRVKQVSENEACKFFHQIITALEYLHNMKIIHRDLKPENILLTNERDILLADFGLSNIQKDLLKTSCGSPCYAAPEMIQGFNYNGQLTDIWSCGIILFAMICGYLPFDDLNTQNLYQKIIHAEYQFPKNISSDAKDLIRRILEVNPQKRLTIPQIKRHKWWQLWKRDNPIMQTFKTKLISIPCLFLPNSLYYDDTPIIKQSPRQNNAKSPLARSPLTKSPNTKSTNSKISSCTYKQVYEKIKQRQTPSKSMHETVSVPKNNSPKKQQPNLSKQINNYLVQSKHQKQASCQYSTLVKQSNFQKVIQSMHAVKNNKTTNNTQCPITFKTPTKLFYSHHKNLSEVEKQKSVQSQKQDDSMTTQNILQRFTSGLHSLINSPRQPQNIRGIEQHTGPFHLSLLTKKHPQLFVDTIHKYLKDKEYEIMQYQNYSITIKLENKMLIELRLKRIEQNDVYYLEISQQENNSDDTLGFIKELQRNIKF